MNKNQESLNKLNDDLQIYKELSKESDVNNFEDKLRDLSEVPVHL